MRSKFRDMKQYSITTIRNYPEDGRHQECWIGLPFQIRKGEDGYYWTDNKGKEHKYNIYKNENKVDERWIVHLKKDANKSLRRIFEIKVSKDLEKIVKYCVMLYMKSLEMETKRVKRKLSDYCA